MSNGGTDGAVGVCIPTIARPQAIEAVLTSVAEQQLQPRVILVVDASEDNETEAACERMSTRFPRNVLRHVRSLRGLPSQRCIGIDLLREADVDFVCMLDDDVTLAPDFLSRSVQFLESSGGADFGGISGYDAHGWGRAFGGTERIYSRLGLYDGELRAGRWLNCGRFLELSRLQPHKGVYPTDFIPAGHTVWRMEVFDHFLPPRDLTGYALLEDKHFSLRVATAYQVGVLGDALVWHVRSGGGRPGLVRLGFQIVRRQALLLRDCDAEPRLSRYAAFLAFSVVDFALSAVVRLVLLRFGLLLQLLGSLIGWVTCVVSPPALTKEALVRKGQSNRRYRRRDVGEGRASGRVRRR